MNNLSWIKNLYHYEDSAAHGNKEKFIIAFISIIIAGTISSKRHSVWPIGICVFFILLTYFLSPEHWFFKNMRYFVFVVFQTLNLLALSLLFYFLITPLAFIQKLSAKKNQFYKNDDRKTLEDSSHMKLEFERLF
jgi:hypothetical protein